MSVVVDVGDGDRRRAAARIRSAEGRQSREEAVAAPLERNDPAAADGGALHDDVQSAVSVQIGDRETGRSAVDGRGPPGAEGAVAVAEQNSLKRNAVGEEEIDVAVEVEVAGRDRLAGEGARSGRLERACAVAGQGRDDAVDGVRDDQIGSMVVVDVDDEDLGGST